MALQGTKEGTRRTKREPGNHVVPGVKSAAKKNRRAEDWREVAGCGCQQCADAIETVH